MCVDKKPRVKKIQIPKLAVSVEKIGIDTIIQLLSRGAELIIHEDGKEIMRINGSVLIT
jgi:hypothetical protein